MKMKHKVKTLNTFSDSGQPLNLELYKYTEISVIFFKIKLVPLVLTHLGYFFLEIWILFSSLLIRKTRLFVILLSQSLTLDLGKNYSPFCFLFFVCWRYFVFCLFFLCFLRGECVFGLGPETIRLDLLDRVGFLLL